MKTYTKDMEGIFMVDLKQKPYFLNDEQIKYIEDKIKEMSIEDKIGQLFFVVGQDSDTVNLSEFTKKYRPGGIMYRPDKAAKIKDEVSKLQKASDIPLFIAANLNGRISVCISAGKNLRLRGGASRREHVLCPDCRYRYEL